MLVEFESDSRALVHRPRAQPVILVGLAGAQEPIKQGLTLPRSPQLPGVQCQVVSCEPFTANVTGPRKNSSRLIAHLGSFFSLTLLVEFARAAHHLARLAG